MFKNSFRTSNRIHCTCITNGG